MGTKIIRTFDTGKTKEYDSLVKKEGLDWPLKAERPFPVSSSFVKDLKFLNFEQNFRENLRHCEFRT